MKCLLKIGYNEFLLPDAKGIADVMQVLSRATEVQDRRYGDDPHILLSDTAVEVAMKQVPDNVRYRTKDGATAQVHAEKTKPTANRHTGVSRKALTGGQSQLRLTR